MRTGILSLLAGAIVCCGPALRAQQTDSKSVEDVFGRTGAHQGDMVKIPFPRSDLAVTAGGVKIAPALALTGWAAFKPMKNAAMMMGDLVLLESEVPRVMKKLEAQGIEITALHNHLMDESPTVMYMHFSGHGDAAELARALKEALSETKTPLGAPPSPTASSPVDWSAVESALGHTGAHNGNVLQVGVPRARPIEEAGMEVPPFMGMANSMNFQMDGSRAAITGDFVLTAAEVNPVLRALIDHGIAVTALHSHMLDETPRIFFMHFWAVDDPVVLAQGLKAALGKIAVKTQ